MPTCLRAYTWLFPYKTVAGPLLLAAIPTPGIPQQYELAYSRPKRKFWAIWRRVGRMNRRRFRSR
jgi:hypothetical protein